MLMMNHLLALTPNITVNLVYTVAQITPGEVHRAIETRVDPRSHTINLARRLPDCSVEIAGFVGQVTAEHLIGYFKEQGFPGHYVICPGETLNNVWVNEQSGRQTLFTGQGLTVTPESVTHLAAMVADVNHRFDWVLFGGDVPPGAPAEQYIEVLQAARPALCAVIADGPVLPYLAHQQPHLLYLTPARSGQLLGDRISSVDAAKAACTQIMDWGVKNLVIDLNGLTWVGSNGTQCWSASKAQITGSSETGAEAALGLVPILSALMEGRTLDEGLRAAAASDTTVFEAL